MPTLLNDAAGRFGPASTRVRSRAPATRIAKCRLFVTSHRVVQTGRCSHDESPSLAALSFALSLALSPTMQAAKVSQGGAEKIALARTPGGSVKESELEKEHGKLVWSFDIAIPGTSDITQVQVDAIERRHRALVEKETVIEQQSHKEARRVEPGENGARFASCPWVVTCVVRLSACELGVSAPSLDRPRAGGWHPSPDRMSRWSTSWPGRSSDVECWAVIAPSQWSPEATRVAKMRTESWACFTATRRRARRLDRHLRQPVLALIGPSGCGKSTFRAP